MVNMTPVRCWVEFCGVFTSKMVLQEAACRVRSTKDIISTVCQVGIEQISKRKFHFNLGIHIYYNSSNVDSNSNFEFTPFLCKFRMDIRSSIIVQF
jgi:hypothetical protein